ncbi:MAG: DegT/DnrJ/EryC1/StrS family aminotransferase, partial [Promethearchaeota archaeon]
MQHPKAIPFYVPWINREDRKAVYDALKSRWLTGGPQAANFEKMFADYVGTKHAVAVSSCTAALHLAMRVLNIKSGDEVIVPVLTFAATANAPILCGAKPVFVDINEKTFNISPKDVLEKITPKTKAIIPVHYGGQPCDMKKILEIAEDHKLYVVEDCAHSLGAEYYGMKTGNFGEIGCFSFYPTKIITSLEGGMVTTNDEKLAEKLRILRDHGMSRTAIERESKAIWKYDVVDLGYNYRLNEAQAALGISQLKRIDEGIKRRVQAANYYTKRLNERAFLGVVPPYEAPNRSHIFHLYSIKIQREITGVTRNEVFKKLSENGIQSSVHYTPLHLMSFYKQFLDKKSHVFSAAEKIYEKILS